MSHACVISKTFADGIGQCSCGQWWTATPVRLLVRRELRERLEAHKRQISLGRASDLADAVRQATDKKRTRFTQDPEPWAEEFREHVRRCGPLSACARSGHIDHAWLDADTVAELLSTQGGDDRLLPGPPDPPPWTGPTSDPGTWVPVAPNTVMGASAALRLAARRNREAGRADDGQACDELADRLNHALRRARTGP